MTKTDATRTTKVQFSNGVAFFQVGKTGIVDYYMLGAHLAGNAMVRFRPWHFVNDQDQ